VAGNPSLIARLYAPVLNRLARIGTQLFIVRLGGPSAHIRAPELEPGYTVEAKKPLDLLPWAKPDWGLTEEFLRSSDARGDRCVANFFKGDLVGYGFVSRSLAPVTPQVYARISGGLQYRYKGWTHPQHRRKHLSHARGRLNSQLFPEDQAPKMISYVAVQNFASRLTHKEVRPESVGLCGIVRIFGTDYVFHGPGVKSAGFELIRYGD